LLDCARGHWLALRDVGDDDRDDEHAVRALRHWLAPRDADTRPGELLADAARVAALHRLTRGAVAIRTIDAAAAAMPDESLAATLARVDRLGAELDWLALPRALGVPRALELALATVAQGLLRDLAWRLPGFARASLPHLWVNFLAVDAEVVHEPARTVARLGRPPLGLILGMTGLSRASYRLPWRANLPIALFPADGR